jgi:UDP-N-acetylmuramoyl-tripeptide--D-alanyl-D-alanine ligase
MKFSLRAVADALGVSLPANPDAMVTGWSVDSRTLQPGDLFFALRGPVHDGHAHIAEV